MSAITLVPTVTARTGVDLTAAAQGANATAEVFAPANGSVVLVVINGAGAPITVTLATNYTVDGVALPAKTVTVPAGHTVLIGPFTGNIYVQSDGNVHVTYSSVTTVTVALIQLGS